jgi:hypothetical protein
MNPSTEGESLHCSVRDLAKNVKRRSKWIGECKWERNLNRLVRQEVRAVVAVQVDAERAGQASPPAMGSFSSAEENLD